MPQDDFKKGIGLALVAYITWGILPLYMKALVPIPPIEIVAHRILWSVPIAAGFLMYSKRLGDFRVALGSPKSIAMACVTASLIAINWLTYIISISTDRALDASMGYYMSPIFVVFLGAVVLKERLKPLQWVAVFFATLAVGLLTWDLGKFPWIAVVLTVSWGLYALSKRALPIGAGQAFLLETLVLLPFAAGYAIWLYSQGASHFTFADKSGPLLIGVGFLTAFPLLVYATAAKKIPLNTIAIMGYIIPTMIFLIAVFIFEEPFTTVRLIAFLLIWIGVGFYTKALLSSRKTKAMKVTPPK